MSLTEWRLIALSLEFPHHAGGSGYGQLIRHIPFDQVVTPPCGTIARAYDRFVASTNRFGLISRVTRRRIGAEVRFLVRHSWKRKKLIHVFYGEHHSWLLRNLRSTANTKKIMTNHLPPSLWYLAFKPGQLDRFDGVILLSDNQREPLRDVLGYKGKVAVIPHGTDLSRFDFPKVGRDLSKPKCVMVGNFLRDYPALAAVASQSPEMEFNVVANSEEFEPLRGLGNVRHHDKISDQDLVNLYHSCNVALFTMRDSTANNAVLEAMATGLPIVGNDVGGIRTYTDRSFAHLTATSAPREVRAAIYEAIEPAGYANRCRAARIKAEEFNWTSIAERTVAFYQEVLD